MSSVQLGGLLNANGYRKSNKSPLKTGAAIGAGAALGVSSLQQFATKGGRQDLKIVSSKLGKGKTAAICALGLAIITGAGALIGLGAGAITKAVKKDGSTEQNTKNTETKTIDKEA